MEETKAITREYVECEFHGESNTITFEVKDDNYEKIFCFKCWVENTTKGLKIFAKEEIKSE